jgi:hypothetical protein
MGATATKIGSGATAITGGHNLRYATTFNAPGYSITLPLFAAGCPSVDYNQTKGSSLCDKK